MDRARCQRRDLSGCLTIAVIALVCLMFVCALSPGTIVVYLELLCELGLVIIQVRLNHR